MQTNTSRGMQTLEQSLAELTLRKVITKTVAMSATSRAAQFEALLERSGFESDESPPKLRLAGGAPR
jgi:Tfp pilus assembly ATPase PilU